MMFTLLAGLAFKTGAEAWSLWRVRMWVNGGLLLIVVGSLVAKRPFTLHHARRRVSADIARSARFVLVNSVLSGAWALAFAVLVAADLLMVLRPQTPVRIAVWGSVAALAAAAWCTKLYAQLARGQRTSSDTGAAQ